MTKLRIVVELDVNDAGIAVVERPERATLECHFSPPTPEHPAQVDIQGDRDGLRWLAEQVLAVANARPEGYHVHIADEDGLRRGVELIVARMPER